MEEVLARGSLEEMAEFFDRTDTGDLPLREVKPEEVRSEWVRLPADLEAVLERLAQGLAGFYGDRYEGLVLHGSYARGEVREDSDVNLLVLLDGEVDRTEEILRMEPVKWPLSLESGYVLSAVAVGSGEFRRSREPFLWNAREEGVVLHGGTDARPSEEDGKEEHG